MVVTCYSLTVNFGDVKSIVQSSQQKNPSNVQFYEFSLRFKELFGTDNAAEIAREMKRPHNTVNNYCKGVRLPEPDILIEIANLKGVSLNWLLAGIGPKFIAKSDLNDSVLYRADNIASQVLGDLAKINPDIEVKPENVIVADLHNTIAGRVRELARREQKSIPEMAGELIMEALIDRGELSDKPDGVNLLYLEDIPFDLIEWPLAGIVQAGSPLIMFEDVTRKVMIPSWYARYGKDLVVYLVQGDSMQDEGIWEGDLVFCLKSASLMNGKMVIAVIDEESTTVKRFYRRGESVVLAPANKSYNDQVYKDPTRVRIVGVVIGISRSY